MKFKEFSNQVSVDLPINLWLEKNPSIRIVDVKYSTNCFGSHALIAYEEDSENGKQDSRK
jgi:hypothetical protein